MTTHYPLRSLLLSFACLLGLSMSLFAGEFNGTVTDQDPGGGFLTVTSAADQTSKTFTVTAETVILGANGKPSDLLHLVQTTLVQVEFSGKGDVATKITVLPAPSQQVP